MEFTKDDFKHYILKRYKPSSLEYDVGIPDTFVSGAHYLSINWDRYYYLIKNFVKYKPSKTQKILNIGSYPGSLERVMREFLKCDAEIYATGLQFSEEYLSIMKEINVQTAEVDIDPPYYEIPNPPYSFDLPYEDNFFDFVFSCEIVEHLLNPLHMFMEVKRVLRPGGTFLLTTPNLVDISNVFRMLMGKTINQDMKRSHVYENNLTTRRHVHLYTKEEMEFIFSDLDFRNIKTFMYNCEHRSLKQSFFKKLKNVIRNICHLFPQYRTHIYIIGKK